jgi:hypothetical protein
LHFINPPTEPVLTLADAKPHLRVDHNDDDSLITALIAAATARLDGRDGILGRWLRQQTWELFPARQLPAPAASANRCFDLMRAAGFSRSAPTLAIGPEWVPACTRVIFHRPRFTCC